MRILTLGPVGGHGGLQTHFRVLNDFLRGEGHEVLSVCFFAPSRGGKASSGVASSYDMQFRSGSGIAGSAGAMVQLLLLRSKLQGFRPELVIACGGGSAYATIGSWFSGKSTAFYTEVIGDYARGEPLRAKMSKAFGRTACQTPRLVENVRRSVRPLPKICVLPCFADAIGERFACTIQSPIIGAPLKLGYFGRLTGMKAVESLVRAFCTSEAYRLCQLHLHGDGDQTEEMKLLARELDKEGRVVFRGPFNTPQEFASRLEGTHGLVMASKNGEGLPLVLIEAMSVGLPFMATNICGIPDAAEGNQDCMLVSPGERNVRSGLELFAQNLLAGNYQSARMKAFYQRRFSREVMCAAWRKFLANPSAGFEALSPL
jgi:glycosyltransferase involved in cell wall biosynthesis